MDRLSGDHLRGVHVVSLKGLIDPGLIGDTKRRVAVCPCGADSNDGEVERVAEGVQDAGGGKGVSSRASI